VKIKMLVLFSLMAVLMLGCNHAHLFPEHEFAIGSKYGEPIVKNLGTDATAYMWDQGEVDVLGGVDYSRRSVPDTLTVAQQSMLKVVNAELTSEPVRGTDSHGNSTLTIKGQLPDSSYLVVEFVAVPSTHRFYSVCSVSPKTDTDFVDSFQVVTR
jgi:hypothetical protein